MDCFPGCIKDSATILVLTLHRYTRNTLITWSFSMDCFSGCVRLVLALDRYTRNTLNNHLEVFYGLFYRLFKSIYNDIGASTKYIH